MNEFSWPVRVYYEDTDMGGIVYYANYLRFMERARTEWLRAVGVDQMQLKQQCHLIFVVRHATVDYRKAAMFDDALQVTVNVTRLGKASLTLSQAVLRQQEILCAAVVKLGIVNLLNWHPQPLPSAIVTALSV
ncbi:MAG: tol-pal system-associated acyl-CoA thioesterase [Beggiatoa sp. IS2]|nr:MAG: tol-pal system-associated acyl-CoA thioesterase [Beggiatoa sp. IS2]